MLRIEQMYAFVSVDPDDDREGVCCFSDPMFGLMPMVGADMARIDSLRPVAEKMASEMNRQISLLRFEIRTELEVIKPQV